MKVDAEIDATENEWKGWISRYGAEGPWEGAIRRSLITLRMLVDRESGGIVAAATLGLPEIPGGSANWDYRYCWLRDSTFTLTALLNAGFHEEATRWRDWILRAVAGQPAAMQIVYRIDGGRLPSEQELDGLPGYQGAAPVRVGNAASGQTQLDVFGELMDSFHVLAKAGIERTPRVVEVEIAIVEHLEKVWDRPSADIWEGRGDRRCYTYSQAMAWVGVTRFLAAHASDVQMDRALIARLKELSEVIHRTVCERGYSSHLGHFVQHYGGDALDASLLLLPLVGFLPIDDPRVASTIAAIERDLMEGGLVRRKPPNPDGHDEGAFLACSCWLADCYTMQGRDNDAATLLERVIGLSNDVGLLSEEYDVRQPRPDWQYSSGLDASGRDQQRVVSIRPRNSKSRRMKPSRVGSFLFAMSPLFLLSGCGALKLGVMNHAGPIAASQWRLYEIVGIVLVFVAGPVLLLTPLIAWHYRLSNKHSAFRPKWDFSWSLEGFIWIPPTAIVIGLGFLLWRYTHTLDPYRPIASDQPALEVQAVGFDWKWLFIYPDERIASHRPAGHTRRPARPYQPHQRHGHAVVHDPSARRPDLRDGGDDDAAQPRGVTARRLSRREHPVQRNRLPEREIQRRRASARGL